MGNNKNGDGYKYRGRGLIQLTGKATYEAFNEDYKNNFLDQKDFVTNPDLISTDLEMSVISALWYYEKYVLDYTFVSTHTDADLVTGRVNQHTDTYEKRSNSLEVIKEELTTCL